MASPSLNASSSVDLLILGAGWTSTFLLPHLRTHHPSISFAATTRDGRDGTIKWAWDPQGGSKQFEELPRAKTVVITFPIKEVGGSTAMVEGYEGVNGETRWVQLGSSGIWDGGPTLQDDEKEAPFKWTDRHSPYATDNPRAMAEDELLDLRPTSVVLNLSGLWGGTRDPMNWISRVAATKPALAAKSSIHLVHGLDVARSIIAVHLSPLSTSVQRGERYLVTDLRVYDWWDLVAAWGLPGKEGAVELAGEQPRWVLELMEEQRIRSLPRTPEELGRALDSTEFWRTFGIMPVRGRIERGRL